MWPQILADSVGSLGKKSVASPAGREHGTASHACKALWVKPRFTGWKEITRQEQRSGERDRNIPSPRLLARGQIRGVQKQVKNSTK